MKIYICEK